MSDIELDELRAVSLFEALPDEALQTLCDAATVRSYKAGETIFNQGDNGDSLHVIRRGTVKILIDRENAAPLVLTTLSKGAHFGELAVIDPAPRSATVAAIERTETIEVPGDAFDDVLDDHPKAARRMLGLLARSLTAAKDELSDHNRALAARVRKRTLQLRAAEMEAIKRLGIAAEFRDDDTGIHITRMSRMCQLLARAIGFDEETCELFLSAAAMHDVGKIGIPDAVLLKPGKLDDEEWKVMKTHPQLGNEILADSDSKVMQLAAEIARCHHEKWDGSGYPEGLSGEDIPVLARICTIADVFDALISERPYKKAFPVEKALTIIREGAGSHFDPNFVEVFLSIEDEVRALVAELFRETART